MSDYQRKRYYWLKFHKDFFQDHNIRLLEHQPNGEKYVLFLLKLMAESCSHEGRLRHSDTIPYNEEMLSWLTDTDIDTVRSAIRALTTLGILEIMEDGTYFVTIVSGMIGSETHDAQRKRLEREDKRGQLEDKRGQCPQEIRDKSKDIRDNNIYSPVPTETETEQPAKVVFAKTADYGSCDPFEINNIDAKLMTKCVIEYLNQKIGTMYKASSSKTQSLIKARLNEGFVYNDFRQVIDTKVAEWGKDEKMRQYLRPVTLFGTKFESYLNQKATKPQPKQADDELLKLLGG